MTGDPALSAEELYCFYRSGEEETLALRGVSVQVGHGEVLVVTGPSGSGKSTLLSCLTGIEDPSGGTVRIEGERLTHRDQADRDRIRAQRMGVLTQSGNLIAHLRVRDNLRLADEISRRGRRNATSHQRPWVDVAARLGITEVLGAWPDELSGGEAARASLAVALAAEPRILVADEPTGELDGATEAALIDLLRSEAARGVAVLIASHSDAVADRADRVVHLRDGQVVSA